MGTDELEWSRAKLKLALSLMTQYQRDRFKRISSDHAIKRGREAAKASGKPMGRPKKFSGHVPGQQPVGEESPDHA